MTPGRRVILDVPAAEMDSLLKSLLITDDSGGPPQGVRYDAADAPQEREASFPFSLDSNSSLASLLAQMRGARVALSMGGHQIAGRIVSVTYGPGARLLLLTAGGLKLLDLDQAASVHFVDPGLNKKLNRFLDNQLGAEMTTQQALLIDPGKAHLLRTGYIEDVPVWKSSYRLRWMGKKQAYLQGWAIVNNDTRENWKNVHVSVTAGRPIAVNASLFAPAGVLPALPPFTPRAAPTTSNNRFSSQISIQARDAADLTRLVPGAWNGKAAAGNQVGALYGYDFVRPVSIRAHQAAMLPFVQANVTAQKFWMFFADRGGTRPWNAIRIHNTSRKTLDGGVVTVFDHGYAGEARIRTLKPGGSQSIRYGWVIGTHVKSEPTASKRFLIDVHFRNQQIIEVYKIRTTLNYRVVTTTPAKAVFRPRKLDIRFSLGSGIHAIAPLDTRCAKSICDANVVVNGSVQRFAIVTEQTEEAGANGFVIGDSSNIRSYIKNRRLPEGTREQLKPLLAICSEFADATSGLTDSYGREMALTQEEQRIRLNIYALRGLSKQRARMNKMADKLQKLDAKIHIEHKKQRQLVKRQQSLTDQFGAALKKLNF